MKLTIQQIKVLVALYELQPATVSALNEYLGLTGFDIRALKALEKAGLVVREKWQPPEESRERDPDVDTGGGRKPQKRKGKRPFMYSLSQGARLSAWHFWSGFNELPGVKDADE